MKKIYLVIAGFFLILLIITSIFLSFKKKSITNTSDSLFPTGIDLQGSNQQGSDLQDFNQQGSNQQGSNQQGSDLQKNEPNNLQPSIGPNNISQNSSNYPIDISMITPIETQDFKLHYSAQLKKLVVERKTVQADEMFKEWAYDNNFSKLIGNDSLVAKVELGKDPDDFNPILELLSIFFNFGRGQLDSSLSTDNPTSDPNLTPFPTYSGDTSGKIYYAQCGDFGSTSLPDGCNLCSAGCGPTTVAMIAASYLNPSYNPKNIVDLYQSKGYYLGCDGSFYTDAYKLFQQLGFQTTTIYEYNYVTADQVVSDLRNTLAGGWAIFTLVKGHFFWVTDIDSLGNIFAYDPAHSPVPFNENSYSPVRLYFKIFGVKK